MRAFAVCLLWLTVDMSLMVFKGAWLLLHTSGDGTALDAHLKQAPLALAQYFAPPLAVRCRNERGQVAVNDAPIASVPAEHAHLVIDPPAVHNPGASRAQCWRSGSPVVHDLQAPQHPASLHIASHTVACAS